jgi:hypothetical protein
MHHRAVLTDDDVQEIRAIYRSGKLGYSALAKRFDSSESTIRDIVKYITRADVPDIDGPVTLDMDKFDYAVEVRQRLLDELNNLGEATTSALSALTGYTCDHIMRSLDKMSELGEVKKHGRRSRVTFTPIATETHSAQYLRDLLRRVRQANKATDKAKTEEMRRRQREPWRTVHYSGDSPAIPNQGGQGKLSGWRRRYGSAT